MAKRTRAESVWATICALADVAAPRTALYRGDAIERLRQLPAESVDTSLTSPPYWTARDYGVDRQIGLEPDLDDYIGRIVDVYREIRRVLVEQGTAWLNIGDCYLSGCGTVNGKPPEKGWRRNKQLSLVPFKLAIALQEDGWWVRNAVVWHKPNAMPSSVTDRLTNTWEPVFLLTKADRYYFNLDAIRVPHVTSDEIERKRAENGQANGKAKGKATLRRWLNSPRHRSTIQGLKEIRRRPNAPDPTILAAYLREAAAAKGVSIHWVAEQLGEPFERTRHYFRTDRIGSRLPPEDTWMRLKELLNLGSEFDEAMAVEVGDNVFRNHPNGRNPGDMVSVALTGSDHDHFATMPRKLADWALKATLPPQGICLDPFMGTGTTGHSTLGMGGKFIGIDIRADYISAFMCRHLDQ